VLTGTTRTDVLWIIAIVFVYSVSLIFYAALSLLLNYADFLLPSLTNPSRLKLIEADLRARKRAVGTQKTITARIRRRTKVYVDVGKQELRILEAIHHRVTELLSSLPSLSVT